MVKFTSIAVSALALASGAAAKYCSGSPNPKATENTLPILTNEPIFVRSVANATLYRVGGEGLDPKAAIDIVHLFTDDAYYRGYAHGELMKTEVNDFIGAVWDMLLQQLEDAIDSLKLPKEFERLVAQFGARAALALTFEATKKYTGQYFIDEMRGLSDASGVKYEIIRDIHMIGELTKGSCSMYGAWGSATENGKTLQLRALDWNTGPPFADYPQITVYHAEEEGGAAGRTFANVGWTAWLGSITGMSAHNTAISEIGVSFPDETYKGESRFGIPFTFLLRDVLQFDYSLQDSIDRITNAKRTCNLILGVGDGKVKNGDAPFRSIAYSANTANFFDDKNMMPRNDTWHPRIENVVYHAMDWLCPSFSEVMARQITNLHGKINLENTVREVTSITNTGNALVAAYDLTDMELLVSYSRGDGMTGKRNAYERQYTHIDMGKVFDQTYHA